VTRVDELVRLRDDARERIAGTRAAAAARPRPADRPSRERGGKENAVVLAITGDSLP